MGTHEPFRVYWQPGCTSCLKAKEFLARHGIAFESIDVRATPGAMDALVALGARSIPVVARGTEWTYAQELDDVARFVGVESARDRLPPDVLASRLDALLAAAARHVRQLPPAALERTLAGRPDRAGADLAYHVAAIVDGLLDAANGGALTYEHFLRRPEGDARTHAALHATLSRARAALAQWWTDASPKPEVVATYYGAQPLPGVLERTAWHVAQHCRQLESLVAAAGLAPDGPLSDRELGGLPLPEGLWDREVGAPT
jgi:glutaredoxin